MSGHSVHWSAVNGSTIIGYGSIEEVGEIIRTCDWSSGLCKDGWAKIIILLQHVVRQELKD